MISSVLLVLILLIVAIYGLIAAFRVGFFAVFLTLLIYVTIILKLMGK